MTVSFRLTDDEERRLDALVARTGRSKSFYVRTALHEYLDDLEDAYAADEAYREFEASGRRSRPLADLAAEVFGDDSPVRSR
jgi:RHH-type rel operon transcriptional repressor/antitoxin RelB